MLFVQEVDPVEVKAEFPVIVKPVVGTAEKVMLPVGTPAATPFTWADTVKESPAVIVGSEADAVTAGVAFLTVCV